MRASRLAPAACLLLAVALPAAAQDAWTGGYVGAYAGASTEPDDDADRFLFDTNLDGNFNDTVRTAAGADAFSPGFCNGVARDRTPAAGCAENTGGADYGVRAGYDWQMGQWVVGAVLDVGGSDVRDAVSAFSTTPARYTMLRKVDTLAALRARVGYAFDDVQLAYVTAGAARASIENTHLTSNGVNTFTTNGDSDATGSQVGLGYERRIGSNWTVGAEYVMTMLDDDEFRVRAAGPAPATNPFILANPQGTDFRRSDEDLDFGTFRVVANWRF
ncbi:outer membrane protein [Lysobacter humi (ex Lee et al. 2017)]